MNKAVKYIHRHKIKLSIVFILLIAFWISLPKKLFNESYSTVILDKDTKLLAAQIAKDGQWRFPAVDSVPEKYKQALMYFEDEYFAYHPGINPVSIFRALKQNLQAGRVVSGGSTITQQVIRMARKNPPRTLGQKFMEMILALRLECSYSKNEIISLYAAHAPFGGNVVGLETASWRYYGRPSHRLSWGEITTLAVLPNAPSLIYPGKNHEILLAKRNKLIDKLCENEVLDSLSCELAKEEELPIKPVPIPQHAPHLLTRLINEGQANQMIHSSIDLQTQLAVNRIIERHHKQLLQNEIHNAAALVLDVKTGKVLAYVGNTQGKDAHSGHQVDIINSLRSSGSTLKPFLYAAMLDEGMMLPNSLVADVPTQISGYSPKNFDRAYDGAVPASEALARSLNVPAVRMLRKYGVDKFLEKLKELGFTSFKKHGDYYGLSLILGGAEVSMWELAGRYAGLSRSLQYYTRNSSEYASNLYATPSYRNDYSFKPGNKQNYGKLGAGAIYHCMEALSSMDRPIEGVNWRVYESSQKIAWKTGTSFGHRDAWAVGVTPAYVVLAWAGNADGEGRPGLTGANSAAPIMFDIFKRLPYSGWFEAPYDDLELQTVCRHSGMKASDFCDETDSLYVPILGERTEICPYHKQVFLDASGEYRVNADCYKVSAMKTKNYFVLPTVMEWYYKSKNPFYKSLPPYLSDCHARNEKNMELIYPKPKARIFIPKNFGNKLERCVFQAAHRISGTGIHWHLDNEYLGYTQGIHELEVFAGKGEHSLSLIDDKGETLVQSFEIVERGK